MNTDAMSPPILIVSGCSGSGKGTVLRELRNLRPDQYHFAKSYTTRKERNDPNDHYTFVSAEEFVTLLSQGYFAEYTVFDGHYYGTARSEIHPVKPTILEIDIQGTRQILAGNLARKRRISTVFILAPTADELFQRLKKRNTESRAKIRSRLEIAVAELEGIEMYDTIILNSDSYHSAVLLTEELEGGRSPQRDPFDREGYKKELLEIISML